LVSYKAGLHNTKSRTKKQSGLSGSPRQGSSYSRLYYGKIKVSFWNLDVGKVSNRFSKPQNPKASYLLSAVRWFKTLRGKERKRKCRERNGERGRELTKHLLPQRANGEREKRRAGFDD
jgi:hypothetical protein